jgi:O-antigen/teichoic acid export membrane protein
MTTGRRRVARSVGVLFVGETTAQALGFVLTAYLARVLGPAGFGVWVFATAVITYLGMVVESGADTWGMREISASLSRVRESLDAVIAFRLVVAAIAGTLLVIAANAFVATPDRRVALTFGLLSLLAMALQSHWVLRSLEVNVPVAAASAAQRIIVMLLAVTLVRAPADARYVTLWQGSAEVLTALGLLTVVAARAGAPLGHVRTPLVRRVALESWPIGVSRLLRGATYTITISTLARFWPDAVVGEYGVAYRIPMALLAISTIFGGAVAPAVARACATSRTDAGIVGSATLRLLAVLLLPLAVGGVVLATPVLTLVFSARYLAAVTFYQLLLATVVLASMSDLLRRVLHFSHHERDDLRCVAIAVSMGVVLSLLLIPAFGSRGAVTVALTVEIVLLALEALAVRRAGISLAIAAPLLRPVIAAAAMAAAIFPLRGSSLALSVPIGALVYFGVLTALGDRTIAELHVLDVPVRTDGGTTG